MAATLVACLRSRLLALTGLLALIGACGLFGPGVQSEYLLVSINGKPLPAPATEGRDYQGHLAQQIFSWSQLVLYENGTYKWSVTQQNLLDGVPEAGMPQGTSETSGHFSSHDSLFTVGWMFEATLHRDTLYARDVSGGFDWASFAFLRQP